MLPHSLNVYQLLLALWHYRFLCFILNPLTCFNMHVLDLEPLLSPWTRWKSLARTAARRLPGRSGGRCQRPLAERTEAPGQITGQRCPGGHSSSRCAGLSLSRPLLLRSTGSRRAGSVVVAHGLSCSVACGIFPYQGSNPCPLHWQADSQPLCHQGSPITVFLLSWGI